MKPDRNIHTWGLVLILGMFLSACQPAAMAVQSTILPVVSAASIKPTVTTVEPEKLPSDNRISYPADEPTAEIKATFTPTRIAQSTLPVVPPGEDMGNCKAQGNLRFEEQTLALVNVERTKNKLPSLLMNNLLVAAARIHSADMACNNYFNHSGQDGSSPFVRMKAAGYEMSYAGENIYAGPDENNTPAEAVRRWMNSSTHRSAILNPNYTEAGVGYYFYQPSAYDGYFTIDFASPVIGNGDQQNNRSD